MTTQVKRKVKEHGIAQSKHNERNGDLYPTKM